MLFSKKYTNLSNRLHFSRVSARVLEGVIFSSLFLSLPHSPSLSRLPWKKSSAVFFLLPKNLHMGHSFPVRWGGTGHTGGKKEREIFPRCSHPPAPSAFLRTSILISQLPNGQYLALPAQPANPPMLLHSLEFLITCNFMNFYNYNAMDTNTLKCHC